MEGASNYLKQVPHEFMQRLCRSSAYVVAATERCRLGRTSCDVSRNKDPRRAQFYALIRCIVFAHCRSSQEDRGGTEFRTIIPAINFTSFHDVSLPDQGRCSTKFRRRLVDRLPLTGDLPTAANIHEPRALVRLVEWSQEQSRFMSTVQYSDTVVVPVVPVLR